ncbi:MAG: HlyD family efflux transporter periplasmic adaptor subunit [Bauldia sp.]|nr:HlyD family efflux transporter periplasmic adaptor subunit [Bauldia sp.]
MPVTRGGRVAAGDVLFRLTSTEEAARVAEAEARVAQAEAQLGNLRSGMRAEEIAVLEAQTAEAQAAFDAATKDADRARTLRAQNVVAQSQVDAAEETLQVATARLEAAQRQLAVGRLPARPEEIAAAERNLDALRSTLAVAEATLAKRTVLAPASGLVEQNFFEAGEFVGAAQPVISLLPDEGRLVRFFVPEPLLATTAPGRAVSVSCDGCPAGLTAEISFVATQPEFTPPVIYSRDNREKLVWMVEARPTGEAAGLPVGQPVDIRLLEAGL